MIAYVYSGPGKGGASRWWSRSDGRGLGEALPHGVFAAAAHRLDDLALLDAELDARTPSPALRLASRRQGRALLRAARATWPSPVYDRLPASPQHPIALGVTGSAAGLSAAQTALAAA